MAGPTKKEIEKIMRDPNSPERKVYDKFLKGNPLFPDLDKVGKKDEKVEKDKKVKKASGGLLKAAPNEGVTKLPKDVRNKMGFLKKGGKVKGYKNGGKVKKCRMDGIAIRGKTRAKQRSK